MRRTKPLGKIATAAALLMLAAWQVASVRADSYPLAPAAADAAQPQPTLRQQTEEAALLAGGLTLQLEPALQREGDAVVLTLALPRAGYLNVVSVGPDDKPTVLFPNRFQPDNRVAAGAFTFPTQQMDFDVKATAPFGPTLVAAFLSDEPLNLYENGDGERDVKGALQERFARLSAGSRKAISELASKSFAVVPRDAPLLGGAAYATVCARSGPCEPAVAAGAAEEEHFTPGILLEGEQKWVLPKGVAPRAVSDKGLGLTKLSEGFVPRLYNDAARYCSIAYGHLVKKKPCNGSEPAAYRRGMSEPQGAALLVEDMLWARRAVTSLVKVSLTDGQYAALCDFTYNVGSGNLKRSTLLKAVNAGQHHRVPFQLGRWVKANGKTYRGLVTRRKRESELYMQGQAMPKAAPAGEDITPLDIRGGE